MNSTVPLVCDMSVFTPLQREAHIAATTQLFQSVQDIQDIENGYTFTFTSETGQIFRLAEFISNERLCCPFLTFTLNVVRDNQPVSLSLTGPLGTQEFLRAEFNGVFQ